MPCCGLPDGQAGAASQYCNCSSGKGDLEVCRKGGLEVLVTTVDLGADIAWDLVEPSTFLCTMDWVGEGLLDVIRGSPPCPPWSRLRLRRGGRRPLRFRGAPCARDSCTVEERIRITESVLMLNFLAPCEALLLRGGALP